MTHVLDTSAILAHYWREPGSEEVNCLLTRGPEETGISLITLAEVCVGASVDSASVRPSTDVLTHRPPTHRFMGRTKGPGQGPAR
jgi:PIN domain nuclease of toxin-antitoxin system